MLPVLKYGLCAAVGLMLFCSGCVRGTGEQIIPEEIPVQSGENPAAGISSLPTAPVTMYRQAKEAYLCPLEEYSWARKHPPEYVMIHFTSAVVEHRDDPYGYENLRALFVDNKVSIHYLVQRDGTVYCFIPEDRTAWHAGVGEWLGEPKYTNDMNQFAIGIELAAIGSAADMEKYLPAGVFEQLDPSLIGFTDAQYEALADLTEDICTRWGIPMDAEHIIGHEAYSPDKKDPGELFQWSRILPEA